VGVHSQSEGERGGTGVEGQSQSESERGAPGWEGRARSESERDTPHPRASPEWR